MAEHQWTVRPFDVRKCERCGEMAFVEALADAPPCDGRPVLPAMQS